MSLLADANEEEVIGTAQRMAEELESFVKSGEEAGCDMSESRALLVEWNDVFQKTGLAWQKTLREADNDIPEIRLD